MSTQGTRVYPPPEGFSTLNCGEYGQNVDGQWWARPPIGMTTGLIDYEVTEHEDDGTISLDRPLNDKGQRIQSLEHGIWGAPVVLKVS
jgi:hypothetical protein